MSHNNFGRRRFIQNAALFSTGLITSLGSASFASAADVVIDAVVIGSGFGGAIAALRLGQAGVNTVVLERGRAWPTPPLPNGRQDTFSTFQNPDGRSAWLSPVDLFGRPIPVYTGVFEFVQEVGTSITQGAGVGGGSLVYNAILYQPPRDLFYRVFPTSINYDELNSVYYPRALQMLGGSPIPDDILATPYYTAARVFLQQVNKAGIRGFKVPIGVDWNIVRQEIQGTRVPSAIAGQTWYGINSGAKNSVDKNYLLQAQNTGKVTVQVLTVVTDIAESNDPNRPYRVSYRRINENGQTIGTGSYLCKYLFLGAGSLGTSKLLVRAKAKGTLPRLNEFIGKGWAGNGDTFAIRTGLPTPLNPAQGGPGTVMAQYFNNPYGPISFFPVPSPFNPDGTLINIGMTIPTVRGEFRYDPATDSVKLFWPGDPRSLEAARFAYNVEDRKNATSTTGIIEGGVPPIKRQGTADTSQFNPTSAHPLGGAVLGQACDLYGRVKGYQGLYVVDGALLPGSTGAANPALTIAAMAERCMDQIISCDIKKIASSCKV